MCRAPADGVVGRGIPHPWWGPSRPDRHLGAPRRPRGPCVPPVAGDPPLPGDDDVAVAAGTRAVESGGSRSVRWGANDGERNTGVPAGEAVPES